MHLFKRLFYAATRRSKGLSRSSRSRRLQVERLAARELLAVDIVFDYTYDSQGFFTTEAKAAIERAANEYETRLLDTLSAIPTPPAGNSWTATFQHPETGVSTSIANLQLAENEVRIYVGARNLTGTTLGKASTGWGISYTNQSWLDTVTKRGQTGANETSTWGGSIAFDTSPTWNFSTAAPTSGQTDFYSVALHELGHIFGITNLSGNTWTSYIKSLNQLSTADQALVNHEAGTYFTGPKSVAFYGKPISADTGHFEEGVIYAGSEAALDPTLTTGTRKPMSPIDWTALDDIGWDIGTRFLSGTVFDDSIIDNNQPNPGEGEPGLTVIATNTTTNIEYTTTTYTDGTYSFELLPGTYDLTFSGGGYAGHVDMTNLVVGSQNVKVDLDANSVTWAQPVPNVPVGSSPSTSTVASSPTRVFDSTPVFQWTSVANAATYQLWVAPVGNSNGVISILTAQTAYTAVNAIPEGSYRYVVRAINASGAASAFSSEYYFDVLIDHPVPEVPVSTGPSTSIVASSPVLTSDATPTFRWNSVANASSYQLWVAPVGDSNGVIYTTTSQTSFTPTTALPVGNYRYVIRAVNAEGEASAFSVQYYFNIYIDFPVPAVPVSNGPSTSTSPAAPAITTDTTPTFRWNSVANAASYQLWVAPIGNSNGVIYTSTSQTTYTPTAALPVGSYRYVIRALNLEGEASVFSSEYFFNIYVDYPVPAVPTSIGPSTSLSPDEPTLINDATPTFQWSSVAGAATYQLWVAHVGNPNGVIFTTTSQTSFTPTTQLSLGSYRFLIRAVNLEGEASAFSSAYYFNLT